MLLKRERQRERETDRQTECVCVHFLIHMSFIWICVISFVQLTGWLAALHGQNLNTGHYMQTCLPKFFIPVMLISAIDFYHSVPLSLTLALTNMKENLLASFLHTFQLIRIKIKVGLQVEPPDTIFE